MKLLLTSAGIKNASIRTALVNMLGKPLAECSALCIPTGIYALRNWPIMAYQFVIGLDPMRHIGGLGWKSWWVL